MGQGCFYKRVLSGVVALAVGVAPTAGWATPSILIQSAPLSASDEVAAIDLTIQFVPAGQEKKAIEEALTKTPDAIFTVFTDQKSGGDEDTLEDSVKSTPLASRVTIEKFDTKSLKAKTEALVVQNPELRSLVEQAQKQEKRSILKDRGMGILASIVGAGGFATSYVLVTGDMNTSAKLFALAFAVGSFQAVANSFWQKYLRLGGKITKTFHQTMAKVIGKTVKDGGVSEDIGRVFAAAGFNIGVAAAITSIQGSMMDAIFIAALGTLGTWDAIWDVALGKHSELGTVKKESVKKFAQYRVMFSPLVEAATYTAGTAALAASGVMAVVGSTGLVTFLAARHIHRSIEARRATKLQALEAKEQAERAIQSAQILAIKEREQKKQTERDQNRKDEFRSFQMRFNGQMLSLPKAFGICDKILDRTAS